jgi:hypothetical protein
MKLVLGLPKFNYFIIFTLLYIMCFDNNLQLVVLTIRGNLNTSKFFNREHKYVLGLLIRIIQKYLLK